MKKVEQWIPAFAGMTAEGIRPVAAFLRRRSNTAAVDLEIDVDTAFALVAATPAPGALILARLDSRGARHAADRGIAFRHQRMLGEPMASGVGLQLGRRPGGERVHLDPRPVGFED